MDSRRKSLSKFCLALNTPATRNEYQVHAGLWLDKYITSQDRSDTESRSQLVQAISDIREPAIYKAFYQRWSAMLDPLYHAVAHEAATLGRIIIGLGNESVLETSLTLHRTYGVPYIPGSALKGVAASYVRQYLSDESTWQTGGEAHTVLFGSPEASGYITFLDALYVPGTGHNKKALHPDVITVHHQNYYQGTSDAAPTDWDNPIPVPFLSATGSYLIALAAPDMVPDQGRKWIDLTFTILAGALCELGVGAKTSSGYGRLSIDSVPYISPVSRTKVAPANASLPSEPAVDLIALRIENVINEVNKLQYSEVANKIHGYYDLWKKLQAHSKRQELAHVIIEKIRLANREKNFREKPWYKELMSSIS